MHTIPRAHTIVNRCQYLAILDTSAVQGQRKMSSFFFLPEKIHPSAIASVSFEILLNLYLYLYDLHSECFLVLGKKKWCAYYVCIGIKTLSSLVFLPLTIGKYVLCLLSLSNSDPDETQVVDKIMSIDFLIRISGCWSWIRFYPQLVWR